ncbi:MAG: S8 family serine peptidase [Tannerellaceae bacterium]|nr:S8 family serine peptidase [Tannerellaceae bacterium]
MKVKCWICYLLLIICLPLSARIDHEYCFRVYLKDKGETGYRVSSPEAFLTKPAIERRKKSGIAINETDLPIPVAYIDSLRDLGALPVTQSKWLSTVVVASPDSLIGDRISNLSMVDSVKWIWKGKRRISEDVTREELSLKTEEVPLMQKYGYAEKQIEMLNGIWLHEKGYTGRGVSVAVIDAGFRNVDRIGAFYSLRMQGTHNSVSREESVFEGDDHGTKVLSCMAANLPGVMVGTAPEADYWLIKSEDNRSEFPIEEDYWAAAVEYADSVGVEVITSSLGYFHFDVEEMNYDQSSLDGNTAFISRAARQAAEKGILLFCSAGNEGNGAWGKITFPADVEEIITVGAITLEGEKSSFSSTGFTADYRVKPDVVALGSGCTVLDARGAVRYANGTSFSTPILAGLGVCLWQAFPTLTNYQIAEILRTVASRKNRPDAEVGYGMPDMKKAYELAKQMSEEI